MAISADVIARARKVKLLVVDIDGVMTDGRVVYGVYGDELKFFDVHDGLGIVMLKRAGIPTAVITAKKSRIVKTRCRDLAIKIIHQGYPDKLRPFEKILKRYRVSSEEVCFMGDDLVDLSIIKRAGLAVAVPNAVEEVRRCAHHITEKSGGRGAVREICDLLLKSQGKWDLAASRFHT
jgi:3-deoxy-D-manno-octulosonate 8-phosphate phosphatase (KDO 8-P phosphatase)